MSRFGPLHVVQSHLHVGDPTRHHLILTPDGVQYTGTDESFYPWDAIEDIGIDVPVSRWRSPAVFSTIALSALGMVMGDLDAVETPDGTVTIRTGGEVITLPLARHHVGGYWRRSVDVTQQLLHGWVTNPASRVLLEHPDSVLATAASVARRRG